MQRKQPIPVTILTGFLGAGKTTLLNRILHADHGLRIAVLVNDFGAVNIDSLLVANVEGEKVSLVNGCICCTIRDDLLDAAGQLIDQPDPPDYIIVEPSGVSDPGEVARTFLLLRPHVQVDSILAVIDCEQLPNLHGRNQFLALEQIGAADIILLNKIDLADPEVVAGMHTWIRRINPDARFLETIACNAPLELLLGVGNFSPDRLLNRKTLDIHVHPEGETHDHDHHHDDEHDDEHEHEHDAADDHAGHRHDHEAHEHQHTDHSLLFSTWLYESDEPLNFKALRRTLEKLPATIFRAKGFIRLDAPANRRAVLQMVGSRVRLTLGELWTADETPRTQIVFIGEPGGLNRTELQTRFDRCRPGKGSSIRDLWEDTVDFVRSF